MKNSLKHSLIAFAAVLAVGAVMAGIGGIMGGRSSWSDERFLFSSFFRSSDAGAEESAAGASLHAPSAPTAPKAPDAPTPPDAPTAPTRSVQKLEVELGAGEVTILPGDDFTTTCNKDGVVFSSLNGQTYQVEMADTGAPWTGSLEVTITVPRDNIPRELDLAIGAGQMTVRDLSCETADLEIGAGQMKLQNVVCTSEMDIDLGVGQLKYEGALSGKVDVDCDMGHVKMVIPRPADFGYRIDCSLGTVKLGGEKRVSGLSNEVSAREDAATFFDIECGMGSVDIEFT